jgi:putative peptidoglycan lipid II flippase
MLSRLLGLVREQMFAALLGASHFADAFNVAFRIPNLLRDLFAEGALSQAFVPTFKATLKRGGERDAYTLANRIAGTLVLVTGAIVLMAGLFADDIVAAMAGDFAGVPGKFELTVTLTRIMLLFLPLISLAAVAMGMLNAQNHFTTPALAPATFNLASIATAVVLHLAGVAGHWIAIGWAIGTVLAGLAQLGIQLPPLWRLGFRPRPSADPALRDPGVRRVARLMVPAVSGLAAVQVNIFINTAFATTEAGATSWLNYAFRFLQLPIGVFGVAIATVSTTRFSDAAADGDRATMARQLTEALRLLLVLTVPATVGLVVLGEPIIRLIYEHGRFTSTDTLATAAALQLYAVGLVAYASVKVVAPAFYALDMARIPMLASITAVAANVVLNVALHHRHGYRVLALGTSLAALVSFTLLQTLFHRRIAPLPWGQLAAHLARVGTAAALMGGACWATYQGLVYQLGEASIVGRLACGLVPVAAGALLYALACRALGVEELLAIGRKLGARLRRRRGPG